MFVAVRNGARVHVATEIPSLARYYKLACTGRAMSGLLTTNDPVTCKACLKGIESGRIA